jgi:hypothetical protein
MGAQTNEKSPLDRTRLCELAKVPRGKHIRWTHDHLLASKLRYGELDLIRAAILDELTRVVKPSLAKTAWLQVEAGLDTIGPYLQVMVCTTTKRAYLVHSSAELDQLLPRNEPVIVVELGERIEEARNRLREFRTTTTQRPSTQPAPAVPAIVPLRGGG